MQKKTPCPVHVLPWYHQEFCAKQKKLLQHADIIVGGKQILSEMQKKLVFENYVQEQVIWHTLKNPLELSLNYIATSHAQGQKIVVVAHGDPLYFGIGASLIQRLGHEHVHVHAGISMLQRICALAGQAWQEVVSVSLHGRGPQAWSTFFQAIITKKPICVLTDAHSTPALLAKRLLERGAHSLRVHVVERWGEPQQKYTQLSLDEAITYTAMLPCTVLLVPCASTQSHEIHLGLDDTLLQKERNLITKPLVRAAILSLLRIEKEHTLWDVGAGSGAVALEATRLAKHVIAIEQHPSRIQDIRENRRRFGALNLDIIQGTAPACLEPLLFTAQPQSIFVGGGLGYSHAEPLLDALTAALSPCGRIVMSAVLLGTVHAIQEYFHQKNWPLQCLQMQVNSTAPLGKEEHSDVRLVPQNPVFLLCTQKPCLPQSLSIK